MVGSEERVEGPATEGCRALVIGEVSRGVPRG